MSKLVAFYSRADENYFGGSYRYISAGNTEKVANMIAQATGADLFKIEQAAPYAADYADNAATTRISDTAIRAMLPFMLETYGNPSSIHSAGAAARSAIESYSLTAYDGAGSATAPTGQPAASGGSNDTGGAGSPADGKGTGKMNASEFIKRLQDAADNHATLYVMGCFGAPLTGANVSRYCTNHSYNKAADRTAMIKAVANKKPPVFGFDCVCLTAEPESLKLWAMQYMERCEIQEPGWLRQQVERFFFAGWSLYRKPDGLEPTDRA